MKWRLPSFEPLAESPKLADDFVGIALTFPKAIDLAAEPALPVFGAFQLSDKAVAALPGQDPFRAVVVLLIDTNGYQPYSFNPAGKSIMLERAKSPQGMFRGYFNVDAFRMARTQPRPGQFFVSAYLDVYRSPSLPVDVTGRLPDHDHDH